MNQTTYRALLEAIIEKCHNTKHPEGNTHTFNEYLGLVQVMDKTIDDIVEMCQDALENL